MQAVRRHTTQFRQQAELSGIMHARFQKEAAWMTGIGLSSILDVVYPPSPQNPPSPLIFILAAMKNAALGRHPSLVVHQKKSGLRDAQHECWL